MNRKDFSHRIADMNERVFDIENELESIKLKIIMEDNPERKEWFNNAQDRLRQKKDEMDREIQEFTSENFSSLED